MNRAERRARARWAEGRGDPADAALVALQQFISGPALDGFMNEVVLHLHGAEPEIVERQLAGISEQLGGMLLQTGGKVSRTVANGLVYATLANIRTRLATAPDGGTA